MIPIPWARILGALALVVAALGLVVFGVQRIKADGAANAELRAARAAEAQRAKDTQETERRVKAQAEIAHDATVQADAARVAAASADRARDALRVRFDAYVRANIRPADPAASAGGEAGDPIGVLSGVFDRMEEAAGRYAAEADANRIAGLACERAYDELSLKP